MRRISDGVKVSERYRTTEQVERAFVEDTEHTFLYEDGEGFHFHEPRSPTTSWSCRQTTSAT